MTISAPEREKDKSMSRIAKKISVASALAFFLCLSSCSKAQVGAPAFQNLKARAEPALRMAAPMKMKEMAMADSAFMEESPESVAGNAERKMVKSARMSVSVSDLAEAEKGAVALCGKFGGYVAASNKNDSSLSIDAKIPSSRFDEAVEEFSSLGRLDSRNVSADDITDSYYDLAGRIKTKEILRERLTSYLGEARSMADLVSIETQLNSVQSDLESMQGRLRRMDGQVDYSAISVSLSLPRNKDERGWKLPSVPEKFKGLFFALLEFLSSLMVATVALVAFGAPAVLLAALFFWLTFGKLGLVRRLFSRLKK